uniref:Metalloendopeptidase n=1 Tax=Plectus sambesii TaxID=2011161 RepID=A0A914VB44_9BILA
MVAEWRAKVEIANSLENDVIPDELRKIATFCDYDEDYNEETEYEGSGETIADNKPVMRNDIRPRARIRERGSIISESLDSGAWWDPTEPVYYDYDETIAKGISEFNVSYVDILYRALQTIQENTCFKFVRRLEAGPKIRYVGNQEGCFAPLGKDSSYDEGVYYISLAPDCWTYSTVVHETFHAFGIGHEQTRPDRRKYLLVDIANITTTNNWNEQFTIDGMIPFSSPFDYGSVMFYTPYEHHASNSSCNPVMFATDPRYQFTISGEEGPTFYDLKQMNDIYKCNAYPTIKAVTCTNGGYLNPRNNSRCNCPSTFAGDTCTELADSIGRSPNCGGRFLTGSRWTSLKAYINGSYTDEHTCIWHIISPKDTQIQLKVSIFDVENVTLCNHESYCIDGSIEIKAIEDLRQTGYRFCCNESLSRVGNEFTSPEDYLPVILHARQPFNISLEYRSVPITVPSL